VWNVVSDFRRYPEWIVAHIGFADAPPEPEVGVTFTQMVRIQNVAAEVVWTVRDVQPPHELKLSGTCLSGAEITQTFTLQAEDGGETTTVISTTALVGEDVQPIFKAIEQDAVEALGRTLAQLGRLSVG
jgi:uncharacterized protein YndB with AHSA1/START domain